MQAVVFDKGSYRLEELSRPPCPQQEALLRVLAAGICGTDFELLQGYHGFSGVPGHEFVGVVEEAPQAPELVGRRVVADINCGCGACALCLGGDPHHCPDRSVIGIKDRNGAFAEYLTAPLSSLHTVPDSLSDQEAVLAEPLAAALQITQQLLIRHRDRIAVLGDGKLGLLAALGLRLSSRKVVLLGRHPVKLDLAAEQGVGTICLQRDLPFTDQIRHLQPFDLVVEATGSAEGLSQALQLVRPRGAVAVKTTTAQAARLDLSRIVVDEIRLIGSRCGDTAQALDVLSQGGIDVSRIVEAEYPLSEFPAAWKRAGKPGAAKVMLRCAQSREAAA